MQKTLATLLLAAALVTLFQVTPAGAVERYTPADRAAIRATPILERPSRPGHFYGNTVRRRADRLPSKLPS